MGLGFFNYGGRFSQLIMKNVLIITSSGGGGLLQSAAAKEQQLKQMHPNIRVIKKDVLIDWTAPVGHFGRWFYNWAQKNGRVFWQETLARCNIYAEVLFFPAVFWRLFRLLGKEEIDHVIDNTPICTSAIVKAIRLYNYLHKKQLFLEKVLVDLPTRHYRFLLKSIKRLSKKNKKFLKVVTIEPLLEKGQSEEEFWQKYLGLGKEQIVYEKYPIRPAFKKLMQKRREHKTYSVKIQTKSTDEKQFLEKCLVYNKASVQRLFDGFEFLIAPEDKLIVLMLGSQPAKKATCKYIEKLMHLIARKQENYHLFVFVDYFQNKSDSLFQRFFGFLKNKPENLNLVPMSFQSDETIAILFHRADLTITRSGGHTVMELMAVAKKEKWIHSEAKKCSSLKQLLKGFIAWEGGNALYLQQQMNGKIVTPENIEASFVKSRL